MRRVTRFVQLAPFVYLVLYAAYMCACAFVPEAVTGATDATLPNSPLVTSVLLLLSRMLKLCRWHKVACLMPVSSQIESFIDGFVFTFTQGEIILINAAIGVSALLFLCLSYKHFFHAGR